MSNYNDKLRFAMTPSGFKDGTLYSQFPNVSASDFDVVRNSIATRVNKDGLIEVMDANVPRLDYSDGGCPKLLTESDYVNWCIFSEDFSQTDWTKQDVSVVSGFSAPDGSSNATKLNVGSGVSSKYLFMNTGGATDYAVSSFFVKKAEYHNVAISSLADTAKAVYFDLEDGTATPQGFDGTFEIIPFANDWYRCSIIQSINASTPYISIVVVDDNGQTQFSGIGGIYIWGAFGNNSSVPSTYVPSYFPTNGSSETRQAEQVINAGDSSTFNSQSGVFFIDFKENSVQSASSGQSLFSITGSGGLNLGTTTNSRIRAYIFSGVAQLSFDIPYDTLLQNKIALIYQSGISSLYVNGLLIRTQSNVDLTAMALNQLSFDDGSGSFIVKGKTKSVQVYDIGIDVEQLTGYDSYSAMTSQFEFNIL